MDIELDQTREVEPESEAFDEARDHEVANSTAIATEHNHNANARVPGVDAQALSSATETDSVAQGPTASEQALGAVPDQIDPEQTTKRSKQFEKRGEFRGKLSAWRKQARAVGADWTAADLAEVQKKRGAESVLIALNARKAPQGVATLKAANQWEPLIAVLPAGRLKPVTQRVLDQMIADDVFEIEDAKKLFYRRFDHYTKDIRAGGWTAEVMRTMWGQLAALPAADVTLNMAITTFDAIARDGGFGPSWEHPDTINTIQIGQDIRGQHEKLEHTVRHEIGHGVHTEIPSPINEWLKNDMQFWFVDNWDVWIRELGGYPERFVDPESGEVVRVDAGMRDYLRKLVQDFTGRISWDPAKASPDDGAPPQGRAAWAAMPGAVKNACAQSTSHWYNNYQQFQNSNGKRYFLNHWYHRPFVIGPAAFEAIAKTNETYTAMSEKEFFANCYAEYFADPAGVSDHSKWGGTLPESIKRFFATCIVSRQPYSAFKEKRQAKPKD